MTDPQQQSLALIHHTYQGQVVRLRSRDGYVNATAMCQAAGKNWADYNRLTSTKEFFSELSSEVGIPITELIQSVTGGNPALQGTWVHPQVAIHLAQWLSAKFAVHEDSDGGENVADGQLAAGEDRARGDRELGEATLALEDLAGSDLVGLNAAALAANRLTLSRGPTDGLERLAGGGVRHTHDLGQREGPGGG